MMLPVGISPRKRAARMGRRIIYLDLLVAPVRNASGLAKSARAMTPILRIS